jgi:hypothetical protein
MLTLPTPFPIPPPNCTIMVVYERLLETLRDRPKSEQEAIFRDIGRFFAAAHVMMMHDPAYREWSGEHRISPQLEHVIRCHLAESESFLQ